MRTPRGKRLLLAAAALAASTTLTACGATATPTGSSTPAGQTAAPTTMTPPSSVTAPPSASAKPVAITHIHAIARDPSDGTLLLATHEGLYAKEADGLIQVALAAPIRSDYDVRPLERQRQLSYRPIPLDPQLGYGHGWSMADASLGVELRCDRTGES